MRRPIRRHLTFANVASAIALFVAVGGGVAWALEANSVRSKHIVDGKVRSKDLKDGGVKGVDVGADAITGAGIAEDSLDVVPNAARLGGLTSAQLEPDAYGRFRDAPMQVPNGHDANGNPRTPNEDVLTLDLPRGNYLVIAKATAVVDDLGTDGGRTDVICRTFVDGDFDDSALSVNSNDRNAATPDSEAIAAPVVMTVLGGSSTAFTVHMACTDDTDASTPLIANMKISALAVDAITNSAG